MSNMSEEESRELKNAMLRAHAAQQAAVAQGQSGQLPMAPLAGNPNLGVHHSSMPNMPTPQNVGQVQYNSALEFEIAVESPRIPSCGLVYPVGSPLHDARTVDIKGITPTEENILMNQVYAKNGTLISELIKSCVMDKRIQVGDMLSGDRHALTVAIRIVGYGADFTAEITCPVCEAKQEWEVDLGKFEIKELDLTKVNQVQAYTNEFAMFLPSSKKNITFKFLTGKEEQRIVTEAARRQKAGLQTNTVATDQMKTMLMSVEGIYDQKIVNLFAEKMPARDSMLLRDHYSACEPKIDTSGPFTCRGCGHEEVLSVPLGPTFLWPNLKR